MSIGPRFAERMWTRELSSGCRLSIHTGDPGDNGGGMIGQGFDVAPGVFVAQGKRAAIQQRLTLGPLTQGGSVTHFGLWSQLGEWIVGGALRERRSLRAGAILIVEPGEIAVSFA